MTSTPIFETSRRRLASLLAALIPLGCSASTGISSLAPPVEAAFAEAHASVDAEPVEDELWAAYDAQLASRQTWANELEATDFDDAPPKRPAPKDTEVPATTTTTVEPAPKTEDPQSVTPKHGRQIIYNASLGIGVYDLQKSMVAAEELPARYGGWIHMRTEGQVVMRLPARDLRKAMDELGKLGIVQTRTLQAEDVTTEYVDLESRIKVLQDTQTQLLALLEKAKTVEEALHVRKALDDVTLELEAALGRMRQLTNLISFSTLTVYLYELGPTQPIPSSNDPFPWVDELGVETTEWR